MIVLVDQAGEKAGSNYYSDGLVSALRESGAKAIVLSNYKSKVSEKIFFGSGVLKFCLGATLLVYKLTIFQRFKPKIIFHCFDGTFKVFVFVKLLSIFTKELICIAHDPKSITLLNEPYKEKIFKICDRILVHNDFSKKILLDSYPSIRGKDINIISHGIDRSRFQLIDKKIARTSLGIKNNQFVMLFFGQIKSSKNLELVIKSIPKILDINPLILVYGKFIEDDFEYYLSLVDERYKKYIRIVPGYVDDSLITELFSASDVSLLPYKEIYQSGVLITSFAFHLPVICSNISGFTSIVKHNKNGFIFDGQNITSFSEACINAHTSNLEEISRNAFDDLKKIFTWESSVKIILKE